jgi:hypothetical protein
MADREQDALDEDLARGLSTIGSMLWSQCIAMAAEMERTAAISPMRQYLRRADGQKPPAQEALHG